MYRKVHILGVQVHNVQFGATGTRRQGKDWRRARLCSGNERQRELICLSNAHAHANFPRWFHWTTIQVVQCDTSQRMLRHRHMRDPSPLSAILINVLSGRIVLGRSVLKQVECSIVTAKICSHRRVRVEISTRTRWFFLCWIFGIFHAKFMCGVSPYPTQPLFALPLHHWVPLQTLPTVGRLLPVQSVPKTILNFPKPCFQIVL